MEESKMGWRVANMNKAVYITRSDIGWYSKHANAYLKPLEVTFKYETTLGVPNFCHVPKEIEEKCVGIVRFKGKFDLLRLPIYCNSTLNIFTGFDFPCMFKALQLKRKYGCNWTVFLWDPPCLSHRDGVTLLRWAIDAAFRFFAKRCDRLVLNIHPGLLGEIGYTPREGQVEYRMQDAWDKANLQDFTGNGDGGCDEEGNFEYDFGVLAKWTLRGGGKLLSKALSQMPGKSCLWIGDVIDKPACTQIELAGRISQEDAFSRLRRCRFLVAPYPPLHVYKWNYPLKVFEYLQLGRPIIASDNPGTVAIAERWPGRISLFRSGDIESFLSVMRALAK